MHKLSNRQRQRDRNQCFQAKEVIQFLNAHNCHVGPTESFINIGKTILKYYGVPWEVLSKKNAKKLILKFTSTQKASEERKRHKQHRSDEYIKYLQSPEWKAFKATIVQERGNKCEQCRIEGQNVCIDLHHITYVRLGHELPQDVKLLCRNCHENTHQRKFTQHSGKQCKIIYSATYHCNNANPPQGGEALSPPTLRREAARKYNQV